MHMGVAVSFVKCADVACKAAKRQRETTNNATIKRTRDLCSRATFRFLVVLTRKLQPLFCDARTAPTQYLEYVLEVL
jgi:hypothetical protein